MAAWRHPQYSAAALDDVFEELRTWRWLRELRTVNHYHAHPGYFAALAASICEVWAAGGRPDRLLMSFHGIPRDYFLNRPDPLAGLAEPPARCRSGR
ncbi:MAG TPA: ferrochelatase [Promineifilum sp.]|nr:ferrochelatase [Promineifilum sp.]